jgi:hypothetical protein
MAEAGVDLVEMLQTVDRARHKVVGLEARRLLVVFAGYHSIVGVETHAKAVAVEAGAVGCITQLQTLINYVNLAAVEVVVEALLETQTRTVIRAVQPTQQHLIVNL